MLFGGLVEYLPNMTGILGLTPSAQKQTEKKGSVAQTARPLSLGRSSSAGFPLLQPY